MYDGTDIHAIYINLNKLHNYNMTFKLTVCYIFHFTLSSIVDTNVVRLVLFTMFRVNSWYLQQVAISNNRKICNNHAMLVDKTEKQTNTQGISKQSHMCGISLNALALQKKKKRQNHWSWRIRQASNSYKHLYRLCYTSNSSKTTMISEQQVHARFLVPHPQPSPIF